MNIQTKTITENQTTTSSFTINKLNDAHLVNDDPMRKRLRVLLIEADPPQFLHITGEDYDALGQWTDQSLNAYIINKYNLTVV